MPKKPPAARPTHRPTRLPTPAPTDSGHPTEPVGSGAYGPNVPPHTCVCCVCCVSGAQLSSHHCAQTTSVPRCLRCGAVASPLRHSNVDSLAFSLTRSDSCEPSPCGEHGLCLVTARGSSSCVCDDGYVQDGAWSPSNLVAPLPPPLTPEFSWPDTRGRTLVCPS